MTDVRRVQPGDLFADRYLIERLLNAGGMGAVYIAEHLQTKRRLALKLMHPEIVADTGMRERFVREAQVSALIDSPNVVDVYDAGVDASTGIPFLAMELLSGEELGHMLRARGRLDPKTVVDFTVQVARGLDRAHAAGVVHRDLKPENLFLSTRDGETPRVKILDFGIAKLTLGATPQTTRASGTPLYMAPEQAKRGGCIGPHTDVWALGLIVYVLLVGRPYWLSEDIHGLYGEIFSGQYDPPSVRARDAGVELPPAFDEWFSRTVNLDPAQRFMSAGEAARALATVFEVLVPSTGQTDPFALARDKTVFDAPRPAPSSPGSGPVGRAETPAPSAGLGASTSTALASPRQAPMPAPGAPWWRVALGVAVGLAVSAGGFVAYRHFAKPKSAATVAPAKGKVVQLSAGHADGTCLLASTGKVSCVGTIARDAGRVRGEVEGLSGVTQLAVGKHHACALLGDKSVWCWGENDVGQLGDGTTKPHAPAKVFGVTDAVEIASSIHGTCARLEGGRISCWGGNRYGQIGDGSVEERLSPVLVEGISGAVQLSLGQDHACAVLGDGKVRCWGRNDEGQVGRAEGASHPRPVEVEGLSGVAEVSLGGLFSCARMKDATVECWGANEAGQLGDSTKTARPKPAPVPGVADVTSLATGTSHACARDSHGALRCWGRNKDGELGDGSTSDRPVPVPIEGSFGAFLAAGRDHTCAVRADGAPLCWGKSGDGQLGPNVTKNRLEPAVLDY